MDADVARKGQDHAGIGLAAMTGIVAGNKLEAVRQSELLRLLRMIVAIETGARCRVNPEDGDGRTELL
jgi:hypothetical protein